MRSRPFFAAVVVGMAASVPSGLVVGLTRSVGDGSGSGLLGDVVGGVLCGTAGAQPISSGFTYQGELRESGAVVTGVYDLRFRLYEGLASGAQIGGTICINDVEVTEGTFTVELDFGTVFFGSNRFLEIDVRSDTGLSCGTTTGFVTLSPRQKLTTTPYASYAMVAASADFATSAGTATSATSATSAANATNLNGQPATFYTNAANLTGTLADARLSANVTTLSGSQTFSGAKSFSAAPAFTAAGVPFTVSSSTKVSGLNADLIDGLDSSAFATASHGHDASAIVSGTLGDARLSGNIPRLGGANTFTGANTFNAFTGVNRSTSVSSNEVFGLQNASGGTGYAGMYISSTDGAGGRPFYGYSVNGNTAWTYTEPGGQWRLHNGVDRMVVSRTTGHVGIGTTSPTSLLEISQPDAAMRIRNTNDPGGGFIQDTFSTLQIGMYNPTASAWGAVPASGTRAMLGVQNTGRVGTLTNTSGSPSWRNTIDDGSGNASFQGNIAANNMPAIKFASSNASGIFQGNSVTLIENITVNVPASGFLRITARCHIGLQAYDFKLTTATLELKETTSGEIVVKDSSTTIGDGQPSASGMNWNGDITLEHSFGTGPGTRSYKLRLVHETQNSLNNLFYSDPEITIMYFPNSL